MGGRGSRRADRQGKSRLSRSFALPAVRRSEFRDKDSTHHERRRSARCGRAAQLLSAASSRWRRWSGSEPAMAGGCGDGDPDRHPVPDGAVDLQLRQAVAAGVHVERAGEHVEPDRDEPAAGECADDRRGEDHGDAGGRGHRSADRHHDAAAGGPLPGRRQRAARDPRDHRRPSGRHRPRFRPGGGDRPGRPRRARCGADQRLSEGDRLPRPGEVGPRRRSAPSPRTASS